MDSRGAPGGMARRTFLAASLSGIAAVTLSSCFPTEPRPSPTSSSPTPPAPPSPTASVPPTPGVPQPTAMRRSRWGTDPFARGAFTFDSVGATGELRAALAEPVGERLVFAGEATSTDAAGTWQGARSSGLRAAADIVRLGEPGERVAVIGAGLAGLTAARTLVDAGFEVIVIEARDRVGGRIDSAEADAFDVPVELGGVFLTDAGEVGEFEADLAAASVDRRPFDHVVEARTPDGAAVPISDAGRLAIAEAQAWAVTQPGALSLASALVGSGAVPLPATPDASGVSPADWLSHAIVSGVQPATGATSAMLAASVDLQQLEPVQLVTGRMADYVEQLADSLDIAVSSVVVRVAYNDERVSLRLDTGESVAADRAIIALPLGVLKTDTVRFSPALPLLHQRAISMIGVGRLDTVWLQFDEAFWRSTELGMADANVLTLVGTTPDVGVWFDVGSATDDAPVLLGLIAAGAAQRLEALDDDAFREAVLAGLVPYSSDSNPEGADDEVD